MSNIGGMGSQGQSRVSGLRAFFQKEIESQKPQQMKGTARMKQVAKKNFKRAKPNKPLAKSKFRQIRKKPSVGKLTKGSVKSSKIAQRFLQAVKQQENIKANELTNASQARVAKLRNKFESPQAKLKTLSNEIKNLAQQKKKLTDKNFSKKLQVVSSKLGNLTLTSKGEPKLQESIRKAQNDAIKLAEPDNNLRKDVKLVFRVANGIVETFKKGEIGENLDKMMSSLCLKNGVKADTMTREANLFGSERKAKLKMTRRLLTYMKAGMDPKKQTLSLSSRQKMTGFNMSVIQAAEKTFKSLITGKLQKAAVAKDVEFEEKDDKGKVVKHKMSLIATKERVLIEEKMAGAGTFKLATFASDYFATKGPQDRRQFVTVKPKPNELEEGPEKAQEQIKITSEQDIEGRIHYGKDVDLILHGEEIQVKEETKVQEKNNEDSESIKSDEGENTEPNYGYGTVIENTVIENTVVENTVVENTVVENTVVENKVDNKFTLQDVSFFSEPSVGEPTSGASGGEPTLSTAEAEYQEYLEEIETTRKFQGEGVVKIHTVIDLEEGKKIMLQNAAGISLNKSSDNVKGDTIVDLQGALKLLQQKKLPLKDVIQIIEIFRGSVIGLSNVHKEGFIHRDYKPLNALVTKEGGKLCDFGTVVDNKDDTGKQVLAGTPGYISPEVANKNPKLTSTKSDIWSVGVSLYETFLQSQHPSLVHGRTVLEAGMLSSPPKKKAYETRYKEPEKGTLAHLAWSCTRVNPDERPTASEVAKSLDTIIGKLKKKLK